MIALAYAIAFRDTVLKLDWTAICGCFIIIMAAILALFLIRKQ